MGSNVEASASPTLARGGSQAGPFASLEIPAFHPHAWMKCGHRQTVLGLYLPGYKFRYSASCDFVETTEGDRVALHDDCPPGWREGDRVALLIPGLAGCHGSPYVIRSAGKLYARGVRVFRLDLRSTGASAAVSRMIGHAGRSEDAVAAVTAVRDRCPGSPIALVGYSMGGNIVLKALGEAAAQDSHELLGVDRAVAIAPPIQLARCCESIGSGINRLYDRNFARMLVQIARQRRRLHPQSEHPDLRPRPRGLREFDEVLTAPLSGFRDAAEYYHQASAIHRVPCIKTPTLILAAEDDPLVPVSIFDDVELPDSVRLHTTRHGGHLGFVGRKGLDPDRRWIDWRVVEAVLAE